MEWKQKAFQELTNDELYAIIKARIDVFIVEQNCPYEELDNFDQISSHLFLQNENEIVAYARLLPAGSKYKQASIGRVLVKQTQRGNGYANELMQKSVVALSQKWQAREIKLQGQEYLREFYASFSFIETSDVYLEDEIPHIDMMWSGMSN